MTGETGMSLAVAVRKRQTVQTARRLAECSRNGGCDRKRATTGCWQTILRDVQLQRERTADGDDLAGLILERVDSDMVAPLTRTACTHTTHLTDCSG